MTAGKRVSEMTDAEVRDLAVPRPVTYHQASDCYQGTIGARERFEELTSRDLSVRAFATLKARGSYDPAQHGDAEKYQPLSAGEHLEVLALGEVLARYYRHPSTVDRALQAGASWQQVAAAAGCDEGRARQDYRQWAAGQHRLWNEYDGRFGMGPAEHAAAISRSAEPDREAGQ